MKKSRYNAERIRDILATAYPGKTEDEIEQMVRETLAQYQAEEKRLRRSGERQKDSEQP